MAHVQYEHRSADFVGLTGAFASRRPELHRGWSELSGHRLGIGIQDDKAYTLRYQPDWDGFLPPRFPELTFSIPDSAAPVVVDLNTHDVEPPCWPLLRAGFMLSKVGPSLAICL